MTPVLLSFPFKWRSLLHSVGYLIWRNFFSWWILFVKDNCLVSFSVSVLKYTQQNNLRGKGFSFLWKNKQTNNKQHLYRQQQRFTSPAPMGFQSLDKEDSHAYLLRHWAYSMFLKLELLIINNGQDEVLYDKYLSSDININKLGTSRQKSMFLSNLQED